MYRKKKIAVIIPAYNEDESLPFVLKALPHYIDRVIVADNGSSDNTNKIAQDKSLHPNVIVCREKKRGYGNACLKAMENITDENIIVFIDADYSDYPDKINLLLDPIIEQNFDSVISNRITKNLKKGIMTIPQIFGNKLAVFLINLLWKFKYNDLGPFRSITAEALKNLKMKDKDYGWTIELQIKLIQKKQKVCEINMPYRKRIHGKSKVSNTFKGIILAGMKILFKIFYLRITEIFLK
jgi:glycosyltransferase involved in cell wall biosynthesis